MSEERLLDAEEVAEILKINWRTVIKLVKRGELKAYDVAGKYRFSRSDVDEYLKKKRVQPGSNGY